MITVNEYIRATNAYVNSGNDYRLFSTDLIAYATPISAAQSTLFTVYLIDGGKFVTDSAGITAFGADIVSVNEYTRTTSKLKNTGLQIKINVKNVSTIYPSGTGYELDGTTPIDVVKVRLANGKVITTDEAGVSALDGSNPTYKVWSGLFTQSGTSIPIVTELKNEIGVSLTWGRGSAGNYFAGDIGPQCPDNKTVFFVSDASQGGNLYGTTIKNTYMWTYNTGASRSLNFLTRSVDDSGNLTAADWNSPKVLLLEIRVYN